ncbi:ABC transporter substrate-binding protein [Telmatospirillum siberiense]|uniref:ABC transporter substrate-binding protein n=1 Tax=Telmatospirillum siberiense TaxID=382514 RepID=A0A2N3PTP1_9PROT|nr:ABC transporter substrate-binding protein [Telmatospirillum siberiense]PKU23768.1 ABC transporter substrate-binding protein [Telmatospirillum siberiense]
MDRRQFLKMSAVAAGGTAAFSIPRLARADSTRILRFVPYADIAIVDPVWTTAYTTRTHALLVFDTLFGLDDNLTAQPQMVEGFTVENDGKLWTLTLRSGLLFHDGSKVLARDCVASIKRWGVRDAFGQALMAATDEITAKDDRTIVFRLKKPFPMLPDALARPSAMVAAMMPERLAMTDPFKQITEVVGSGPFRYLTEERVAGARHVYARHEGYAPRGSGAASFTAGPKVTYFDRVEFQVIPDAATAVAALQTGSVDWVEAPMIDLLPTLRKSKDITVEIKDHNGMVAQLAMNHTQAPFNNPAIRRIILKAVNQVDCMTAVAGSEKDLWSANFGFYSATSPMRSGEGLAAIAGPKNTDALKKELAAAGYKGERVVMLAAQDVPRISAVCEVVAEMFRNLGINLDFVASDWGTVIQRRTNRRSVDEGGWSCFVTYWSGLDMATPATNSALRANGEKASPGWPSSPALESLRERWLDAKTLEEQKKVAGEIQLQAVQDVPFVPAGQYFQPTAYRRNLTGMLNGFALFTNLKKA